MPSDSKGALVAIGIWLVTAGVWTEALLYSQNTLYLNNRWSATKLHTGIGLKEFFTTRQPLARNRLNLGSWGGYQEIVTRSENRPIRLKALFEFARDSYLDLTFNRRGGKASGIRLSSNADRPGSSFQTLDSEKFIESAPLTPSQLRPGFHEVSLTERNRTLRLRIDGLGEQTLPIPGFSEGAIGFRSGLHDVALGPLTIEYADGSSFGEDFRNRKGWFPAFLITFALLAIWPIWGALFRGPRAGRARIEFYPRLYMFCRSSLALGVLWFAFDFGYWSNIPQNWTMNIWQHPDSGPMIRSPSEALDYLRSTAFSAWYRLAGQEPVTRAGLERREYSQNREAPYGAPLFCSGNQPCQVFGEELPKDANAHTSRTFRVLFLSGSQWAGYGARTLDEFFFVRTHQRLAKALENLPTHLESISLSSSMQTLNELQPKYSEILRKYDPDLVLLGHFDFGEDAPDSLRKIKTMLNISQNRRALSVFVAPALNSERPGSNREPFNFALRYLASRDKDPVLLDPNELMLRNPLIPKNGQIWADDLHLNPYGQELLADWLAPRLLQIIKKVRKYE